MKLHDEVQYNDLSQFRNSVLTHYRIQKNLKYDPSILQGAQLPSVLLRVYLHVERTEGILVY